MKWKNKCFKIYERFQYIILLIHAVGRNTIKK